MKVITRNPIIIDSENSYLESFSNLPDDENLSSDNKTALLETGKQVVGGLVTALAQKQPRQLSEIEQKCGKRPKIGKKKKEQWQKCVDAENALKLASANRIPNSNDNTKKPMSKNLKIGLIVGGSVLALTIIGLVIYKTRKNN